MGNRSAPSPGTIALAGLMLLALAVAFGIANSGNSPAPQADEIVMDPEVVELDPEADAEEGLDGSGRVSVQYKVEEWGFETEGSEEIFVVIEPYEDDQLEKWNVQGTKASTQTMSMAASDLGGNLVCWSHFRESVVYTVLGIFTASDCKLRLQVSATLTSSELLSTDCRFDVSGLLSMYMYPLPEDVVFTASPQSRKLGIWTFTLDDCSLPGVIGPLCPGFR